MCLCTSYTLRLEGKDLGVVWTAPLMIWATVHLKDRGNVLEIEVTNLWVNRLIGNEYLPDDGIKDRQWPGWPVSVLQCAKPPESKEIEKIF